MILILFEISARADIVYLRDGTVLVGKVVNEKTTLTDPVTGTTIPITKGGGFYAVIDGARYVIFSVKQLDPARIPEPNDPRSDLISYTRLRPKRGVGVPPPGEFGGVTEFNNNWERTLTIRAQGGNEKVRQRLTLLSPYMARIEAIDHVWSSAYMTKEINPSELRAILCRHPDLEEKDGKPDADKRMKIYRFFVQAKMYTAAERELDSLLKAVPQAKEQVEKAREGLRSLQLEEYMTEIEIALTAGRTRLAREAVNRFPVQGPGAAHLGKINVLKARFEAEDQQIANARRWLLENVEAVTGSWAETFTDAVGSIRENLLPENLSRLEPFLALADQAARLKAQGKPPGSKPEELIALAISGWLLGRESADKRPDAAIKLWSAREFVLNYLRTTKPKDRAEMIYQFENAPMVALDELSQLIGFLPPTDPEEDLSTAPRDRRAPAPSRGFATNYVLQLPPEYSHGRPTPLLVVLGAPAERPRDILDRFAPFAARHGYLLAAVEWSRNNALYGYSPDEHARVLDVLRDMRRHFNIDSDRVFLSGYGDGGNMAWDVGLSHPDLFAGVLPISAFPKLNFVLPYWRNAMYLPFYVVSGDFTAEASKNTGRIFREFTARGFPAMNVVYHGRGFDWFPAELPYMFEWMEKKRRATGTPDLGRNPGDVAYGEEFHTMRTTDDRFYWIGCNNIADSHLVENVRAGRSPSPAKFQASIRAGNQISIYTLGVRDVTVWLARGMIDFEKPITFKTVGRKTDFKRVTVKPSLAVMLEDFFERGDRQRLFVAKAIVNP
jgi:hypothetical protein